MTFAANDYLDWYIPRMQRGDGAINLHASGVAALGPEFSRPVTGNPWSAAGAFEEGLAHWLACPASEVLFTPGATGGTLMVILGLARPGRTVVVEAPMYEPMVRQATRLNPVRRVTRRADEAWRLPVDRYREALAEGADLVLLTDPHNPSGVRAPRDEVLALAKVCRERGAVLVINEVYRGFAGTPSSHGEADNILVVSSFSKLCGAYWARLGFVHGPAELVARVRAAHVNCGMPTQPGAAVGLAVLERLPELIATARAQARSGQERVQRWLDETPGLRWTPPAGPGFGAIELPPGMDDVVLAEHLHDRCGVLVVPGSCFEAPGTLRIAWLQSGDRLGEGLATVAREVAAYPSLDC